MVQMNIVRLHKVRQQICPPDTFNIGSMYFEDQVKSIRSKNTNRIIILQININSIRNTFDELVRDGRGKI